MADELVNKLVTALTSLRDQGKTPTQAVEHIILALGGHYADVARISVLNAQLITDVLCTVYQDEIRTPELVVMLRNMRYAPLEIALALHTSFPALDAHAVGALLLSEQAYPSCEQAQMREALLYAHFPAPDCEQALAALYPA